MPSTSKALSRSLPGPRSASPSFAPAPPGTRSIDAALRSLPSHGWTAGWAGRRDRALLVLRERAGLSFADLTALTVDDIEIEAGVATVRAASGRTITLRATDDGLLCGPCALARWLHALDLSTLHHDGRVVASVIARAAPLTYRSPHVCEGHVVPSADTPGLPVFPPNDPWTSTPPAVPPTPTRPTHGPRPRAAETGPGHPGNGPHGRTGHPHPESKPAPEEPAAALESRVRALLAGAV